MNKMILFNLAIYSILIIPSRLFVIFDFSSQRAGLVVGISIFIIISMIASKNIWKMDSRYIKINIALMFFIAMHYCISCLLFKESDGTRFVFSYLLLLSIIITAMIFLNLSRWAGDRVFNLSVKIIYYLLLLDGIISSYNYFFEFSFVKEMFFFREPSHFALIFIPFLAYISYKSSAKLVILNLLITLGISLVIQNMTLMLGILLVIAIFYRRKVNYLYSFAILCLIVLGAFIGIIGAFPNNDYFSSRIKLDPENVSALVFMSGWESAYTGFIKSYGIGIGFQQLGIVVLEGGKFRKKLSSLNLEDLNIYDGGSLAPKILAEFGLFGFFILLIYLYFFVFIYKKIINREIHNPIDIFFAFYFVSFIVYLFIRGAGYFSPSVFVFFVSIYWFYKSDKNSKI